jgi:murein DD-endopeptidase MepM/ murein hydrolase activator NlpD
MMPDYPALAARLTDQPDLYAALLSLGGADLAPLLAACDADVAARLRSVDQGLLRAVLRAGAGLEAVEDAQAITAYLATVDTAPMFDPAIGAGPSIALPTAGQRADMPAFSDRAFDAWFSAQNVPYGLGLYGEHRKVYATPQFADRASDERRTVHLGIDVFAPAGTPVHAPLPGRVRSVVYNADPLDYGHTLVLEHEGPAPFFTLYGHMGASLPDLLAVGDRVAPGQVIAHFGDWHENGGWAPHLHFQVMTSMLEQTDGNFFGVGQKGLWPVWAQISPDPNLLMRLEAVRFTLSP